jgi:hypothetical protein
MKGALKKVIIFVVLVLIIGVGYAMVAKDPEIEGSLTATPAEGIDESLSTDTQLVLALLQSISNLDLDTGIFDRESYLALEDQNKNIVPDLNPGRDNPFAPMGVDVMSPVISDGSSEQLDALNNLGELNSGGEVSPSASSTVSTLPASTVTKNTAILAGRLLTANVGAERYFQYGLSATNLSSSSNKVVQATIDDFAYTASNLIPNTTYYFQAVVKVGSATLRGEVQSFKTLP